MIQRIAILLTILATFAVQAQPHPAPIQTRLPVPRLVIVSRGGDYCNRSKDGALIVTIRNSGLSTVSDAFVHVTFGTHTMTTVLGVLPAGDARRLRFSIPAGCFSPDCSFRIRVTNRRLVRRDQRLYASANGHCIG